jgi:hypothetical protein
MPFLGARGAAPDPRGAAAQPMPGVKVAQITVNAEGRVTAVAEVTVRARWG